MNAVDFLRSQKKNNNIISHIEKIMSPQEELEKLEKELTIDDVLFGRFEKNKKNSIVHKTKEFNKDGKPKINKKNTKILKLFLQQEADKINESMF